MMDSSIQARSDETSAELRQRLELVEARAWDLEQRLRQVEATSTPGITPQQVLMATSAPVVPRPQAVSREDMAMSALHHPGRVYMTAFDERFICPVSSKGYPDSIQRGLVSQEQVDMAFQLFKHRFSRVLPFAPYLIASTPTPTHPFVVLAILTHIPSLNSPAVLGMVEESILHTMTGAVSSDTVLALLILALQPVQPTATFVPTSTRVIALAHSCGIALGFEARSLAASRRPAQLMEPWWSDKLDEILLWETVKLQYNLIHASSTRIAAFLPLYVADFPEHPSDNYREAIGYLQAGSTLLDILSDFVDRLSTIDAEITYEMPDLPRFLKRWQGIEKIVAAFRLQHPRYDCVSRIIEFILAIRTTFFIQAIPAPIEIDHKFAGLTWTGQTMIDANKSVVDFFERTTETLPTYVMFAIAMSVLTAKRAAAHIRKLSGSQTRYDEDVLARAEIKLNDVGGLPAAAFKSIVRVWIDEFQEYGSSKPRSTELSMFDFNDPTSFLNFDFAAWDSLFGGFVPPADGSASNQTT